MACSGPDKKPDYTSQNTRSPELDSLISVFNGLSFTDRHDSLVILARPVLSKAILERDTLTETYTRLFMAQSFLFLDNLDSVKFQTDIAGKLIDRFSLPNVHIIYSNIMGSYCLRTELDYTDALNHYFNGLKWAEKEGNINNKIALLSNIVNIFYIQKNPDGMEYAEKAMELAMDDSCDNNYIKCGACVITAEMHMIAGEYQKATDILQNAGEYAVNCGSLYFLSNISLLYAQIYQRLNEYDRAGKHYLEAIKYISHTDPGTASSIYLKYGDYLKALGHDLQAGEMYRKGLDISELSGNVEYRQELLKRVAETEYKAGKYASAGNYYRQYIEYSDSISNRNRAEFNRMMLSRQQAENDNLALTMELERQKARTVNGQITSNSKDYNGLYRSRAVLAF